MKVPPLWAGAGAGLALMLVLAPATGNALGELSRARAERTGLARAAAAPPADAALVAPDLVTSGGADALIARIRDRARAGGVLVEEIAALPGDGKLVAVRLRLSGAESAVLALADTLERGTPLVRLRAWRLTPIPEGGIRLLGEAVAVRP